MPIKTGGGLETVTLVLTQGQAAELRRLTQSRRTDIRRVSLSDIAREVVQAGLAAMPNETGIAPAEIGEREAAVA